jgi:hypothetical protein
VDHGPTLTTGPVGVRVRRDPAERTVPWATPCRGTTAGDLAACDDLYWSSPYGSDDEAFGSTCGDRRAPTRGNCADA